MLIPPFSLKHVIPGQIEKLEHGVLTRGQKRQIGQLKDKRTDLQMSIAIFALGIFIEIAQHKYLPSNHNLKLASYILSWTGVASFFTTLFDVDDLFSQNTH